MVFSMADISQETNKPETDELENPHRYTGLVQIVQIGDEIEGAVDQHVKQVTEKRQKRTD
jgi:hypothetical protein